MPTYHRPPAKLTRFISSVPSSRFLSRATYPVIREENQTPHYDPRKYYPARVGEILPRRYRIISKLGWGANSTVWLAKDTCRWGWQSTQYVTLKITICGKEEQRSATEELDISRYISKLRSEHEGRAYVRLVRESFGIRGALGEHLCLVYEPLREPLWLLGKHLGSKGVPLAGLDFLHSECGIIHTDLKEDNHLVRFEDSDVLENYVHEQESNPTPLWDNDGHPVFQSRTDFGCLSKGMGLVQISDFSAAVFGNTSKPHNHDIQPQPFCALEELLADDILFDGLDSGSAYSRAKHIAQIIRVLGPPLLQLLGRADKGICSELFPSDGEFKHPGLVLPEEFNLSNSTAFLQGEDKRLCLEFVGKMLRWEPADRATASELYNYPWLSFKP
ncbi:kinase domain protein [Aspergillus pseudonomiae]|uniref:non-specific serine/threonine protein kinase n=1 Tax=Aspergillus pseudonomiae TaxID=1506151 RepID=A0A5N7DKB9_9EURO|nr:kinase domain protein [Aspergillus pseudonomiae]KAE8406443.1 kinase domain protein [Aspergillus pseudonomiae]